MFSCARSILVRAGGCCYECGMAFFQADNLRQVVQCRKRTRNFTNTPCLFGQTITFTKGVTKRKLTKVKQILSNPTEDFLYNDPTAALQKYLEAPLFGEGEKPFVPTKDEMIQAQQLFTSRTKGDIRMVDTMIDPSKAPMYNLPEIALLGESNVGKSSLLRAIFHQAPDVKVPISKEPGWTKTLRFYQVKNYFTLVDMPGYGFAQPEYFKTCVEDFLKFRRNLVKTFMIFDMNPESDTLDEISILESLKLPYCIILNKIDMADDSARLRRVAQVRQARDQYASPCCFPQPFLVSSVTGEGLAYIQSFIAYITGGLELQRMKPVHQR